MILGFARVLFFCYYCGCFGRFSVCSCGVIVRKRFPVLIGWRFCCGRGCCSVCSCGLLVRKGFSVSCRKALRAARQKWVCMGGYVRNEVCKSDCFGRITAVTLFVDRGGEIINTSVRVKAGTAVGGRVCKDRIVFLLNV